MVSEIITAIQDLGYFSKVAFAGYRRKTENGLISFIDREPVNLNERVCFIRYNGNITYGTPYNKKSCPNIEAIKPLRIIAQLDCADSQQLEQLMIYTLLPLTSKNRMTIESSSTDVRAIFEAETGGNYDGNNVTLVSIDVTVRDLFNGCSEYDPCSDCC